MVASDDKRNRSAHNLLSEEALRAAADLTPALCAAYDAFSGYCEEKQ